MTLTNRATEVLLGHALTLPKGWAHATLGDILKIVRGVSYEKADARKEADDNLIPILRATNIGEQLDFDDLVYVPNKYVSDEQRLLRGDIVVAASSGSLSVVGKAARLKEDWRGSFGAFCMGLRVAAPIESAYVAYFLGTTEYRHGVSNLAAGSNINNLRRTHIESFLFPLAPLNEQRRIVAKIEELFSDLDAGVAALERVKAKLKRYRAAVLKAAVEGRLTAEWRKKNPATEPAAKLLERILAERRRKWEEVQLHKYAESGKPPPNGWREKYKEPAVPVDDLPRLPTDWVWGTIEQISTKVVDGVHKKPNYVPQGVPFVTVRNLTAGPGISFDHLNYVKSTDHGEFIKRANPQKGDILVSKDGTLGVIRVVKTEVEFSIFVSVAMVKPVLYESSDYLGLAMSSSVVQRQMVPKGSGLQHIHLEDLREDAVPLPPLSEQGQIVAEVERRLSVVEAVEAEVEHGLKRATRLRQAILKRAFEGKLVPQDPADEPATVLLERIQVHRDSENHRPSCVIRKCLRKGRTLGDTPTLG